MAKICRECDYCHKKIKEIRNDRVDPRFCSTPCKKVFMHDIELEIARKKSDLKRLYILKEKYLW